MEKCLLIGNDKKSNKKFLNVDTISLIKSPWIRILNCGPNNFVDDVNREIEDDEYKHLMIAIFL